MTEYSRLWDEIYSLRKENEDLRKIIESTQRALGTALGDISLSLRHMIAEDVEDV